MISDGFSELVNSGLPGDPHDEVVKAPRELTPETLRNLLHPKEQARAMLVWVSAVVAVVVLSSIIVALPFILPVIAIVGAMIWLAKQLAYALFRGNAIEIGPAQFPDIHEQIVKAAKRLGLTQEVVAFVVNEGVLNAFFYRKSGRKILVINSAMVVDTTPEELDFVILRFMGYLRARQVDLGWVAQVVDVLNVVPILGILTKSYDRAAVLSGDRIGAYACDSTDTVRSTMAKFAVGDQLKSRFSSTAYLSQAQRFRQTPWNFLSRIRLNHPHFSDRMIELDDFLNQQASQTLGK